MKVSKNIVQVVHYLFALSHVQLKYQVDTEVQGGILNG